MSTSPSNEDETYTHYGEGDDATYTAHPSPSGVGMLEGPSDGVRVGAYELLERVGSGGMGQVFIARNVENGADGEGGELVALKWLGHDRGNSLHRFKREFRVLADVRHENLVHLHELVVLENSRAFFTMELLDGRHFHKYVRGRARDSELPNLIRLRRALRQLVAGVRHLHANECVHRDLKPSNVLVTQEGRVVILDFGLISDRESHAMTLSPRGVLMGTPAYIAPEHAARDRADKPADIYAIGVMLYLCLSGRLPFMGSPLDMLTDKQQKDAPDVAALVPRVPADLASLCARLLSRDPGERPTASELFAILDGDADSPEAANSSPTAAARYALGLASRERVLEGLGEAFARLPQGPVQLHLRHGQDPVKGALLDHFFDELREREGEDPEQPTMLLRGRCHARESVPYKGIDQIVDALTLQLCNASEALRQSLEPTSVAPLLQMFPVLNSVWIPDRLPLYGAEKNELRAFGVAALREVLVRAAEQFAVVVCIEDFHWAERDGAQLLTELFHSTDSPRVLLVVSYDPSVPSEALEQLEQAAELAHSGAQVLELPPLPAEEAIALARALVGERLDGLSPEQQRARLDGYVERARGDTFHLSQLILDDLEGAPPGESVTQMVVRRILALPPRQRQLLAITAACDGRSSPTLLSACVEGAIDAELDALVHATLLRREDRDHVELAHHSIPEVVLSEFEGAELQTMHQSIADAQRSMEGARLDAIAHHLELAGAHAEAIQAYARAGEAAGEALAFSLSASLFQRALTLIHASSGASEAEQRRAIERQLSEQLVNAGRAREAVEVLLRMAEDSEPEQASAYREQAGQLYIQTGRVPEGLEQLAPTFAKLGETVPRSRLGSVLLLLWRRLRLRLRGLRYTPRPADAVPAERLEHLDTLLSTYTGLTHEETLLAVMFHARYFQLALDTGEPARLSRGFTYEAVIQLSRGNEATSRAHIQTARELIANQDSPEFEAAIDYTEYFCMTLRHEWREVAERWPRLIDGLEGAPGVQYIRGVSASRYSYTLVTLGQYRELDTRAAPWMQLTQELGLQREDAILSAMVGVARLVLDPTDEDRGIRSMLERARRWDTAHYSLPHFHVTLADIARMLCRGEYRAALEACERAQVESKRWRLDMFELVRMSLVELHGRTCAAALAEASDSERATLQARALADAKVLRSSPRAMYRGQADVIEAAICSSRGQRARVLELWNSAAEAFEAAGMRGHLAALDLRRAERQTGRQREDARARAQAYFDAQRITASERFARLFVPI